MSKPATSKPLASPRVLTVECENALTTLPLSGTEACLQCGESAAQLLLKSSAGNCVANFFASTNGRAIPLFWVEMKSCVLLEENKTAFFPFFFSLLLLVLLFVFPPMRETKLLASSHPKKNAAPQPSPFNSSDVFKSTSLIAQNQQIKACCEVRMRAKNKKKKIAFFLALYSAFLARNVSCICGARLSAQPGNPFLLLFNFCSHFWLFFSFSPSLLALFFFSLLGYVCSS